ncbi:MAG: NERD domain-containing protein [Sulfurovaceae bacterium]|nr:NERD domain-containing protein [Sulfurovaceae bacterium]
MLTTMVLNAIYQNIHLFFYLFLLAIVVGFFKSPFMKGKIGEGVINFSNSIMLDKNIYTPIKNVTLKLSDGSTTQIDHILVSKYGIFIIETKNMKGWIFGGEHQKEWTQQNFKQKYKFQNPIHQNYRHAKALEEILELPSSMFVSIIVFVGDCTFKTPMPQNVFRGASYSKYITSFKQERLTHIQVRENISKLEYKRLNQSFKTDRTHVNNLKERQKQTFFNNNARICNRCGSAMVLRRNKQNGEEFYGCSSYPRCKNIVKK